MSRCVEPFVDPSQLECFFLNYLYLMICIFKNVFYIIHYQKE